MGPEALIWRILEIESRAGRLEGLFAADEELGQMWRSQVTLTEACRSVGLEDIHVFEGDVIFRHLENRLTESEAARGAAAALELMRVISAPGDLASETEHVIARCWNAAVAKERGMSGIVIDEIAPRLRIELQQAPTPIMGAIRAAAVFRAMTDSQAPSVDRLIFMAAEHSLRKLGHSRDPGRERAGGILKRMNAGWIATPSIALTQGHFRAWSPGSDHGYEDLLAGIGQDLDRALGAMPLLLRWRDDARDKSSGLHGKSKLRDLVELALREPILTSSYLKSVLGCSERASLYLMKQAEDLGILTLITPRKSFRVWATPQMAQILKMRVTGRSTRPGERARISTEVYPAAEGVDEAPIAARQHKETQEQLDQRALSRESWEERSEKVLAELDAAMAQADAVLAKYRQPRENR